MSTPLNKLASLLASPAVRLDVYRKVRQSFKGVKALCAATASEYLIRAGVLSGYRAWTSQLEAALLKKGWVAVSAIANLQPYDFCYTVDSNHNGAPDHVFFFVRWLDRTKLVAEVVDNYNPHPHPRNLGASCWYGGKRLAYGKFSHAQRLT